MIYLDSAATSLVKPACVEQAVVRAIRRAASPGRGGHAPALYAAEEVYTCRETAAAFFKLDDPARVVFTQNATHALNIAVSSLVHRGERVVISGFEHNSVTRPLAALGADIRVAATRLFDPEQALESFDEELRGASAAVCTHVSNVFGYVLPIYEIAELCRVRGVPLVVDASQSAGVIDIDSARLGAAFIAMPGHKSLLGPQGTGLLLCTGEYATAPIMHGGSGSDSIEQHMPLYLPDRLEAGTLNVPGIAGLRAGLEYLAARTCEAVRRRETALLTLLRSELCDIPGLEVFAGAGETQCSVLSVRYAGINSEELAAHLSERGVCVRAGLHCAPRAHISANTIKSGTVRFSVSPFVTEREIKSAANILKQIINDD